MSAPETPEISVVLPVYNGAAYLRQAVASILAQDASFELIACDDVSTDGSAAILASFSDPRIIILRNDKNLGIFGNLNRCIAAARGRAVQVFSQDDVMLPGYLVSQLAMLDRHPQAGLVYGSPGMIDADGQRLPSTKNDTTPEVIGPELYLWLSAHFGSIAASISSVMVLRKCFAAVGPFDARFAVAGDLEFYNRLSEKFTLLRNSEPLHLVRAHRLMTSALPGAGRRYLAEEALLQPWYKSRLATEDYARVIRYRAATRGRYHLGWIRRLAGQGHVVAALQALIRLARIYPLHFVLAGVMKPAQTHRPSLPPPGGW